MNASASEQHGIPDLCMHACILAYWGRSKHGSIAGTVPDTSRHTYRCSNNAQGCQPDEKDLGLDMEPRGGMPLPLMLLELVMLMQGDDTGREHGMYPRPATPLT